MIKTIEVNTIEDASKLLIDHRYDDNIGRLRSDYLYRGVTDTEFDLKTSLFRNCGEIQDRLEPSILRYFTKYGIMDDPSIAASVWRQMIMGQHHGLPTRLLDWSHSSLIALHFATAEDHFERIDERDGVVWRIDAKELASLLPENYRVKLSSQLTDIFSVDSLSEVVNSTAQYDSDMKNKSMVIIEPPSSDQRIINQYSYFSIVPMGITDIGKFLDENTENTVRYVIKKNIRWDIRDMLDQLNISERIAFPGLDGLSKWIARHYYVRR